MSDRTSSVCARHQVRWREQVCEEVLQKGRDWTRITTNCVDSFTSIEIDDIVDKGFEGRANTATFGYWMTLVPVATGKLIEILEATPAIITFT